MFEFYLKNNKVSANFGEVRYYGKHEGINIEGDKSTRILNYFDGTIESIGDMIDRGYGNYVIVKHNAKEFFGINEKFYTLYGQLFKIFFENGNTIRQGMMIGLMGNSGDCLTKYDLLGIEKNNCYRNITIKEMEDIDCNFGVNLHLSIYQEGDNETFLEKFFKKNKILNDNDIWYGNIFKGKKIYYNPLKIFNWLLENKK
jgi:hypothetical protein